MRLFASTDPELQQKIERRDQAERDLLDEAVLSAASVAMPPAQAEQLTGYFGLASEEWRRSVYRLRAEGFVALDDKFVPILTEKGIQYVAEHPLDPDVQEMVQVLSQKEKQLTTIGRGILEQRNLENPLQKQIEKSTISPN